MGAQPHWYVPELLGLHRHCLAGEGPDAPALVMVTMAPCRDYMTKVMHINSESDDGFVRKRVQERQSEWMV